MLPREPDSKADELVRLVISAGIEVHRHLGPGFGGAVELKAVEAIAPVQVGQVLAYLRAAHRPLGLLINFNVHRLREGIRRVINTSQR
jgi:hypothetical protein